MLRIVALTIAGIGVGALIGYFGKCASGACPLTANPARGALFGALIGAALGLSSLVTAAKKPPADTGGKDDSQKGNHQKR